MGYYMGDFYVGNGRRMAAFRGDPGFWSFLGGIAKSAVGLIPGVGPSLSKLIPSGAPAAAGIVSHVAPGGLSMMKTGAQRLGRGIIKHPVLSAAGAAGAVGAAGGLVHHIMAGEKHRKRRRMNPCNGRALRRAVRRALAFERIAMRTIHLIHPKKKARFGGFRMKRKRAA